MRIGMKDKYIPVMNFNLNLLVFFRLMYKRLESFKEKKKIELFQE